MAKAAGGVPKEDRQFSLILALLSTRTGLTKNQIFETVYGYAGTFDPYNDRDLDRVNRMFERDKEEISSLGAVIERTETYDFDDNQDFRYTINADTFELPADITFSAQEMGLLTLAGHIWSQGSLSLDSRHALTKLASLGVNTDDNFVGYAPRLNSLTETFEALSAAQRVHGVVSFLYAKPGDAKAQLRTVAPLGLSLWHGDWYLLALDQEIEERRTFLLKRILNTPKRLSNTFVSTPVAPYARELIEELENLALQNRAEVIARPGSSASSILETTFGSATNGLHVIPFADAEILADQLVSMLDDVTIIGPPSLVETVTRKLDLLISAQEQIS